MQKTSYEMRISDWGRRVLFRSVPAAEPPQEEASASGVGDIVVTAQRRSENLQDVTVAISALGGDSIEKFGITDVLDIAAITPGVTMTEYNVGEPQTYIRGVGSQTDRSEEHKSELQSLMRISYAVFCL